MLTTLTSVYLASATGLGGYNIGSFFLRKAVERRRARKAQAIRDAKADDILEDLSALRDRLYSGKLNATNVRAVRDMINAALAEPVDMVEPVPATRPAKPA